MFIIKDKEMEKVIKDKSVIIIGSAPSILKNTGKFVDSFDIVLRVNNYKIKGFEKNVGTRIDIHYSFFGRSIRKTDKELKGDGVKFIMCKYPNEEFTAHTGGKIIEGKSDKCKWVYELRKDWWPVPIWIPKVEYFKENYDKLSRIPTTGISAILDVLRFNPGKVYVTGFDFMTSGIHNVNEKWNDGDGSHHHNREMQLVKYLKNKYEIICDKTIDDILVSQ